MKHGAWRRDRPLARANKRKRSRLGVHAAPRLLGDGLLREEARRGDHAEPRVGELLLLHQAELGRVGRREAERVEADLAGLVAGAEGRGARDDGGRLTRLLGELAEGDGDAVELAEGDAEAEREPPRKGQLRDLVDGRAADAGEERVEVLLDDEADRGEHADAAVRELALAVPVHLQLALPLQEAVRVEVELLTADDVDVAGQAVREGARLDRSRLLGGTFLAGAFLTGAFFA